MPVASGTLRVAAAQIVVGVDLGHNLARIRNAMRQGASRGAQLIVFPETALTGYSPAIGRGRDVSEWLAIDEALQALARHAAELGLWAVVGSEVWDGLAWRNRLLVFDPLGREVAHYDKAHLMDADTRYYEPGLAPTWFDLDGIRVGLQICYDVRFPEGYRELLHQGVQVIVQGFYGAGGDTWKTPVMTAHLRSRAAESGCFVVAANVAGPLQFVISQVIDPLGLILAEANQDREEIVVADLDLSRVAESEIRRNYFQRFRTHS